MALSFNGTSDILEEGIPVVTAYPFSVSFWFKPTQSTVLGVMWSCINYGSTERWQMTQQQDSNYRDLELNVKVAGVDYALRSGGTFNVGEWNHACAICASSTSRKVSLNGGAFATDTTNLTPTGMQYTFYGARRGSGTAMFFFNGGMAEFGIWTAALTDAEAASLAKGSSPARVRPQSLIRSIRMVRSQQDLKGSSNTLTGTTVGIHPRVIG